MFVVGMHRSGTTMVTRALHDANVFSGALLDHNQEPQFAIDINETLLNEAGGNWWSPSAQPELERILTTALPDMKRKHILREFINKPEWRASRAVVFHPRPWVLKDPRLCLTLPWWIARFPRAKVLWVQRDSAAVVDSLLRRQDVEGEAHSDLTPATAQALVDRYDEAAVRSIKSTGTPFMTIHYEALTSSDSAEQSRAWKTVYQYAGAKCGQTTGFAPRRTQATSPMAKIDTRAAPTAATGPLVSVIVPNYNHAAYLDERIGSIVNQTYKNIEILLMDDCSPDNSREVLEKWAESDDRISLKFNTTNSGSPFHQWNLGANWAQGKYLWIAESDDVAELDMLATHVEAMEANDEAVIAYSQSQIIDENSERISSWNEKYEDIFGSAHHWSTRFTIDGKIEVAERMVLSNTIPNASGTLMRKSSFLEAGLPETSWKLNGDWLFYSRLLQLGDVEYFSEERNKFRQHNQTQRMRSNKNSGTFFEVIALLDVFEEEEWTEDKLLLAARRQISGWWINSIFHMLPTPQNLKDNVGLYRAFSRYDPHIPKRMLAMLCRKCLRWSSGKFHRLKNSEGG